MVHFIISRSISPLPPCIPVGEGGSGLLTSGASMTVSVDPVDSLWRARILLDLSSRSDAFCSDVFLFSSYWVTASCLTSLFLFNVRFFVSATDSFLLLLRLSSESWMLPNLVSFSIVQLLFSNMTAALMLHLHVFISGVLRVSRCSQLYWDLAGVRRSGDIGSCQPPPPVTRARPWISQRPLRQTKSRLLFKRVQL